jgi:hypothetical protein
MWSKPAQSVLATPDPPAAQPLSPSTARQKNPGRRYAQIVRLKPEFVDKYKEVHAAVWPEVLKAIRSSNIQDCE